MLIVADENIPYVLEAFGTLGEVRTMPGRKMTNSALRDAEMLLVRSVTPVDEKLLDGTRIRFVGTATIGTDHIDIEYLRRAGIAFAGAPGSNANSVAEYVAAALCVMSARMGRKLRGSSIGIIGVGNVGGRVARKAEALGMSTVLNDPPLRRRTGDRRYRPLDEALECDFVTLHVPLEKSGPDATYHMVDDGFLRRMRPDAVLINTSRGAVADTAALLRALDAGRPAAVVLDVWEGEPDINIELLRRVAIGTPHVAGYSLDGKVNGTEMIYRAACEFLGVEPRWSPADSLPPPDFPEMFIAVGGRDEETVVREAVLTAYPIERDDAALRRTLDMPRSERGAYFDRLRKEYPVRREFHNITIILATEDTESTEKVDDSTRRIAAMLRGLGFRTLLCRPSTQDKMT